MTQDNAATQLHQRPDPRELELQLVSLRNDLLQREERHAAHLSRIDPDLRRSALNLLHSLDLSHPGLCSLPWDVRRQLRQVRMCTGAHLQQSLRPFVAPRYREVGGSAAKPPAFELHRSESGRGDGP